MGFKNDANVPGESVASCYCIGLVTQIIYQYTSGLISYSSATEALQGALSYSYENLTCSQDQGVQQLINCLQNSSDIHSCMLMVNEQIYDNQCVTCTLSCIETLWQGDAGCINSAPNGGQEGFNAAANSKQCAGCNIAYSPAATVLLQCAGSENCTYPPFINPNTGCIPGVTPDPTVTLPILPGLYICYTADECCPSGQVYNSTEKMCSDS